VGAADLPAGGLRSQQWVLGSTYGPLTGIIALLIWAQLTSIALFLGIAFCAQLEAVRAGVVDPERGDPEAAR
jgi:uncharacterized BrkB/YihY/UPF0761 family membrane protein